MTNWICFDEDPPRRAKVYEWKHQHKGGFVQRFHAPMRMRGAGHRDVLSPSFDHWDGYRVIVPRGMQWRHADDQENAKRLDKEHAVSIEGISLRDCPFCGTLPEIHAAQCGYPGGGNGEVMCASPLNYNTWRVRQCCRLVGFNGFDSPFKLASAWNGPESK